MDSLEKWLVNFLKVKNRQGIKCKITLYMRGKTKRYMFHVDGELRNIENYLTAAEVVQYRELLKSETVPS
ncbi:hypothetical protein [Mucilaginibacter aquaedulcis]|uniref:hypothetical protein n=1 Tax=Mucilaginibacter aquaedulcis TaxID=1187081 RepID=UPI0025B2E619|nr:hypothetical protein [Mucilaginibacter aquaedulcis]MDN3547357.1 hypothetical protein [Mucilaginibacter aquaedulcis]